MWRPAIEGGGHSTPELPIGFWAGLRRSRDRVNMRLMHSRVDAGPDATERANWLRRQVADLPPLPLSLCMLAPAASDAQLEPAADGSWKLIDVGSDGDVAGVAAVGVVVPEGRLVNVVNDCSTAVEVRLLDGGFRLPTSLRSGETFELLSAQQSVPAHELRLLVRAEGVSWHAAIVRVEECDSTTQYGTLLPDACPLQTHDQQKTISDEGYGCADDGDLACSLGERSTNDEILDMVSGGADCKQMCEARRLATLLSSPISPFASPLGRILLSQPSSSDKPSTVNCAAVRAMHLSRVSLGISPAARSPLVTAPTPGLTLAAEDSVQGSASVPTGGPRSASEASSQPATTPTPPRQRASPSQH